MTRAELRTILAAHREATLSAAVLVHSAILASVMVNHPETAEEMTKAAEELYAGNTLKANLRAVDQLLELTLGPAMPNARERVTR